MGSLCRKCGGDGYIKNRAAQVALGLFTFGLAPLIDKIVNPDVEDSEFSYRCKTCGGTGYTALREATPEQGERG